MKKIKTIHIQILLLLIFFVVAWSFWAFVYPAHLYFQEELQLFEFTRGYFCDVIVKPAGLAEYISRFLVQFFYNGALGPIVMALLLTCVYCATTLLYHSTPDAEQSSISAKSKPFTTKTLAGFVLKNSLALVPAVLCWAFMLSIDAKPTMIVALVVSLLSVWATEKAPKGKIRVIVAVVVSVVLAFTVGSIFLVYLLLAFGRMAVESALEKNWKSVAVDIVCALVIWGLIILAFSRLYPYPTDVLTWGEYYNRFVFMPAAYNTTTWWAAILVGLLFTRVRPMLWQYAALIVVAVCATFVVNGISDDEEALLDNLYLVHNERWDDILEKANDRTPTTSYEQTALNLALAMKGQLADKYFTIKQYGIDGLLPIYQMDYMTPLLAADAYFQMGMINTAQRFYYESMESIADHQKSAFLLKRLTMTALANGRINLAKRYLRKLKNTLYYKYWAEQMQRYADHPETMDQNAELNHLRALRTRQESFFDDNNAPSYMAEMLNGNPNNVPAWQYMFTMLMVEGRMEELMQTAAFYSKHFPDRVLPVHVQEALLYFWVTKTNSLSGFPFKVSTEIGQRFMAFAKAAYQSRQVAEPIVRNEYGDTFWCYALFHPQTAQQLQRESVDGNTSASAQNAQSSRE